MVAISPILWKAVSQASLLLLPSSTNHREEADGLELSGDESLPLFFEASFLIQVYDKQVTELSSFNTRDPWTIPA